ncbi:hypothetical protein A5886_001301 [Enterococcus sp. 8G7_MSG3316]|uniref:DUF4234 domain-containing protein n=1 Tax=Candidatus Enterococcus testudinis TaxID=1834191 RepID=A0A242A5C4_9ENTE|nr:DUF4234 domain-containing protein [Enterococcus sp. 8G7_MSG3316]OTN76224.1 hypothetical protein A5886_001301 [Enterococcus sp. 8G7_MSG3316]
MGGNYAKQQRSVLMVILLTIITCGIYYFFWFYQVTKELTEYSEDDRLSPGLSVVLTIVTCGFYQIYWWYRIADVFVSAQQKAKYPRVNDNKILFVVLTLFGLDIINMAILQSDMNQLWKQADQIVPNQAADFDDWTDY